MSLLRLERVRREIGPLVILDDISGAVAAGDRIGLVGANGAGKTTLLRIGAGLDEPDGGRVIRARGRSLGLSSQESNLDPSVAAAPSLRAAIRSGAAELEAMEAELGALEAAGAEAVASEAYADLRHRFEARDGYGLDQRVEQTLSGLGFERGAWDRPPSGLSGGEQTRAALARLLVAEPDLLLLDEPTNHLDLAAIEWLEAALARRSGALIVASHDRAFLDAVVDRIWELRDHRLRTYRGAYSAYLAQREAADALARKEAVTSRQRIAREEELVGRFRSHRKYSQMHEHERRLDAARQSAVAAPRRGPALALGANLSGGGPVRSGDLVVALREAVAGFPPTRERPAGRPVLRVPRLELRRGQRVGIVGPNGAGKTTLLRTIAGELPLLDGTLQVGAGVQPGYLAQLRVSRLPGLTVLDALLERSRVEPGAARAYLARFLFRGDDVAKPVAELSGGERSRLELALLGISPANLLLLDEPTNHLDIPAREALEVFLRETPATILLVSHDRRLLETVCGGLWVVEAGIGAEPGLAVAFDGGWRAWREAVAEGWTAARAPSSAPADQSSAGRQPVGPSDEAAARPPAADGSATSPPARVRSPRLS
ncbi:MAG TPA: ABC-F family ATP-binding cassette domain-containing protein, partial [Candidatus Limnocylindrales bacterium]|nr:ABC-F family ATP-binding cassette domain-containing protein [Candidatus Limnocylindrales bacterium]